MVLSNVKWMVGALVGGCNLVKLSWIAAGVFISTYLKLSVGLKYYKSAGIIIVYQTVNMLLNLMYNQ